MKNSAAARYLTSYPKVTAIIAGGVAALGQAPFDLWGATLVGLIAIGLVWQSRPVARRSFAVGWIFGLGYFGVTLNWLASPFMVEADIYGWMAPFAIGLMATGLALFWGAAFAIAAPLPRFLLAFTLALAELARAYVLTGFPWGMVAYAWIDTPLAQFAAWGGPHAINLLIFGVAFAAVTWRGLLAGGAIISIGMVIGMIIMPNLPATEKIVRVLQPNAVQAEKWDPEKSREFFLRLIAFTAAEPRPDLIVWPETSVPEWLNDADASLALIAAAARRVPVIFGIQRFEDGKAYNSALLMNRVGVIDAVYDKFHLVPFGEYMPFQDIASNWGLEALAAQMGGGYAAGDGPKVIEVNGIGPIMPLICYEAVFPQDVANYPERPEAIIQITNDAWFGHFSGPYQHLQQVRMRAIEQGLPVIRSANTGVSAVIDAAGRIVQQIPLDTAGRIDVRLPSSREGTIYSRTGDLPIFVLLVLVIGSATFLRKRLKH